MSTIKRFNYQENTIPLLTYPITITFSSSPQQYTNVSTGHSYIKPEQSYLFKLAFASFNTECYASVGLFKDRWVYNPTNGEEQDCSIIYYVKHRDQISYDRSPQDCLTGPLKKFFYGKVGGISERKKLQKIILKNLYTKIVGNVPSWNFDENNCFLCLDAKKLMQFRYQKEPAEEIHAIILFHKHIYEQSSKIEEIL